MSDFENSSNPYIENKSSIQAWEHIAKYKCRSSEDILALGIEIGKLGIRTNDALHIACAIKSECEYFITTDTGLTKKVIDKIQVINPIDFVRKTEGNNDD
jgi:predicted nucleic acid-binding protein